MSAIPRFDDITPASLLEPFLALMPDAAVIVDQDGQIALANEQAAELFGYAPGDLAGRPIEALVPERFRSRHRHDRAAFTAAPRARPMGAGQELTGRRRDGSEFAVEISLAPLPGADGELVIAAVRDATERHAAHRARSQLATIVESSLDGIISLTLQGNVVSWNRGAEGLFGYGRDEIIGLHISLVVAEERSAELEELMEAALAGTSAPPRDTQWTRRDGSTLDVALSISPLRDHEGRLGGFSALLRDVTERKRRERHLVTTATVRMKLLAGVPIEESLELIGEEACILLVADAAAVVVTGDIPRVLTTGPGRQALWKDAIPAEDSLARLVLESGGPQRDDGTMLVADRGGPRPGPVLGVPVLSGDGVNGALLLSREPGGAAFDESDAEILGTLADQGALGIELGRARRQRELALLVGDRERIGRDLHDLVIQRLFAIGMDLQGIARLNRDPAVDERLERAVDVLDATIREIRSAVFQLDDR